MSDNGTDRYSEIPGQNIQGGHGAGPVNDIWLLEWPPEDETRPVSAKDKWHAFRRSQGLVIAVVFVSLALQTSLSATLEAILPCLLLEDDQDPTASCQTTPSTSSVVAVPGGGRTDPGVGREEPKIESLSGKGGVLLAVKFAVEIVVRPLVGIVVGRFGHKSPLLVGCVLDAAATIAFAFVKPFPLLILIRMVQGLGSSVTYVAAVTLLAERFKDKKERTKAFAVAFGGYAVGMLGGYSMGSVLYQLLGRLAPFLLQGGLKCFDAGLRLLVVCPTAEGTDDDNKSFTLSRYLNIIRDPYIIHALGLAFVTEFAYSPILAMAPPWLLQRGAQEWQIGVLFLVSGVAQLIMQEVVKRLSSIVDNWILAASGLLLSVTAYISYPWTRSVWEALAPNCILCAGFAFVMTVVSPIVTNLVELRHNSEIAQVLGLSSAMLSLGFAVGTSGTGALMAATTFEWGCYMVAFVCIIFACLCLIMVFHPVPVNCTEVKSADEAYERCPSDEE
ncbi:chromaffin granule amine transporter-like isoform X1 [Lingula anatina]|uniref:Chromaffin granule amine transporter-like isoform X1 n=1 Tax=Lingula anatina TaxID=7574 RepID=A0A1S3HJV1_LINAN|nr:chromaffin granule amine transporter-like isoform X1 [Lingula anatina]|eukprot:XP_013386297.1 chromaffin granule amine transporter-like isoform X1 [Lingula anatina]